jgi:hypothetical protein
LGVANSNSLSSQRNEVKLLLCKVMGWRRVVAKCRGPGPPRGGRGEPEKGEGGKGRERGKESRRRKRRNMRKAENIN